MKETNFKKSTVTAKKIFSVKRLTVMAMLSALIVIVARFCAIPINEGLRLGFDSIPVLLAGIWLGPIPAAIVGGLADVVGTLINSYGGPYFPPMTVTPMLVGIVAGVMAKCVFKGELNFWKLAVTVIVSDVIGNIFYGSLALSWYYQIILDMPQQTFIVVFLMRLTKLITVATDTVLVWVLHGGLYNRVIKKMI